jgi:hypothetical protein
VLRDVGNEEHVARHHRGVGRPLGGRGQAQGASYGSVSFRLWEPLAIIRVPLAAAIEDGRYLYGKKSRVATTSRRVREARKMLVFDGRVGSRVLPNDGTDPVDCQGIAA